LTSETVAAHGGGLDANGCHHDRKHGGYHCHRGSAPRAPTQNFAPTPMPSQRLRRFHLLRQLQHCRRGGCRAGAAW
jgi:hypothetical protein